ncbi:MAG: 30S ribosomal protein S18 [Candidatus Daviesbacteria bacterium]|nr:30S ribosomal protein S18 [Candidatus Daviesbacteria bacterium]
MAEKKIVRKVISRTPVTEVVKNTESTETDQKSEARSKKVCFFCQSKTSPSYTDIVSLRRFTTDRAKIVPKAKSGVCSKHQRAVTRNIKYARHLSLLPFVPTV